jgi:orotate phosphoribosyltransferase
MTITESLLLELLKARCFKRGEFKLASGEMSDHYIDVRMASVHSKGAYLIGQVFYDRTWELSNDAIGGMEVGAVPLVAATTATYAGYDSETEIEGFWVRDKAKTHGTQKFIEGNLQPGMRAVIVDDVTTSGMSALRAAETVHDYGCEVVKVISLVDRLQGAAELFQANHFKFESAFTIDDFRETK